jgi:hypothetical protein
MIKNLLGGFLSALLLFTIDSTAFSQVTYYRDNNSSSNGFGALSGNWNTSQANWTTSSAGNVATTAWVNDAITPNDATFDFVDNSATAPAINLLVDLNLRNLEIKGLNNMTGTVGPTLAVTANSTLTFGTGATVTVEDRPNFTYDFYIRQLNGTTADTFTLNINSFTKAGAGNMLIGAHAQTTTGATAVTKVAGTVNVSQGQISLVTFGSGAGTSRSVDVGDATFSLASGTVLSAVNPLSYAGTQPANGTAALGTVTGDGTIRGEMHNTVNTLTITAKSLIPGTVGTVGTLTMADLAADKTNTINQVATAATSLSFSALELRGLKFDLAASGISDQIIFSELKAVDASALTFDHFEFNTLAGFESGNTYTLMTSTSLLTWNGPSALSGKVGDLDGTITRTGNDLVLNVIPEPSSFVLLAGGLLTVIMLRRRQSPSLR